MGINIDAFWVYGFRVSELGEYKYNAETKTSYFLLAGKEYPSEYMALSAFRKPIPWRDYDAVERVKTGTPGNEPMVYCTVPAHTNSLNSLPGQDVLDKCKAELLLVLEKLGVEKKEPTLYFSVDVNLD